MDVDQRERRRLSYQRGFDGGQSLRDRNVAGQFATPPALARAIAREALRLLGDRPVRFGEPSVGSGAFYSALLSEGAQPVSAWGVENDPELAAGCRALWGEELEVIEADFTEVRGRTANLLLANPPYVRHHHLSRAQKARLRERVREVTGVTCAGLSGLYVHFMFLGMMSLEPGGVAAWLVPAEWLRVGYGKRLREWLACEHRIERVHVFDGGDEQFGDALVSSSVVFVRRAPPAGRVVFTTGGALAAPAHRVELEISALREAERWPPPPITDGACVGDAFSVKRGVATGANGFFLMSRARAASLALPASVLRAALPSPRELDGDVIDSRGELVLLDCHEASDDAVGAYLRSGEAQGLPSRYLLARRRPWYRQEQRPPAPFVCAYMGRKSALRLFWNQARLAATNRWLLLYPRDGLDEREAWHLLQSIEPADAVAHGRQYGGGLYKLEPSELLRLPLRGQPFFSHG